MFAHWQTELRRTRIMFIFNMLLWHVLALLHIDQIVKPRTLLTSVRHASYYVCAKVTWFSFEAILRLWYNKALDFHFIYTCISMLALRTKIQRVYSHSMCVGEAKRDYQMEIQKVDMTCTVGFIWREEVACGLSLFNKLLWRICTRKPNPYYMASNCRISPKRCSYSLSYLVESWTVHAENLRWK